MWFTHNSKPLSPEEEAKFNDVHSRCRELASLLQNILPADQPETGFALQRLEEVVYWANTAISRS